MLKHYFYNGIELLFELICIMVFLAFGLLVAAYLSGVL